MKKENQAIDVMVDWILSSCKKLIEKAHFDQTYTGIISKINAEKQTCEVHYAGKTITIKTTALSLLKIGDPVKICIPLGNRRKAFIIADLDFVYQIVQEIKE